MRQKGNSNMEHPKNGCIEGGCNWCQELYASIEEVIKSAEGK